VIYLELSNKITKKGKFFVVDLPTLTSIRV